MPDKIYIKLVNELNGSKNKDADLLLFDHSYRREKQEMDHNLNSVIEGSATNMQSSKEDEFDFEKPDKTNQDSQDTTETDNLARAERKQT